MTASYGASLVLARVNRRRRNARDATRPAIHTSVTAGSGTTITSPVLCENVSVSESFTSVNVPLLLFVQVPA